MRKPSKSFTVEVKRRPNSLAKKPMLMEAPAAPPAPPAAAVLFSTPAGAPAAASTEARRILPCLVTEAALDAAKAAPSEDEATPRPRGRPRKQRAPEEIAPLAPRKRGRPRKIRVEAEEPAPQPARAPAPRPTRQVALAPAAPVGASPRSSARRAATSELPRSERWKRRLPKALR